MSTREILNDLLEEPPENVAMYEGERKIQFVSAVRRGLAEIERGDRIPIAEVEAELSSWVIK